MATLTQQDSATAEQLVVTDGARKIFFIIIIGGVALLLVGLMAAIFHWGAGPEQAAPVAGHPIWLRRLLVSLWHSNL